MRENEVSAGDQFMINHEGKSRAQAAAKKERAKGARLVEAVGASAAVFLRREDGLELARELRIKEVPEMMRGQQAGGRQGAEGTAPGEFKHAAGIQGRSNRHFSTRECPALTWGGGTGAFRDPPGARTSAAGTPARSRTGRAAR